MMTKVTDFKQTPIFPELEEAVQEYWQKNETFKKSVESRPTDQSYVFYDGPPFATGMPHYGHLLASTTKDVIPRYWTMKGYRVERVWGWDCHGLPIENMIEKQLDIKGGKKGIEALGIDKFNQACRAEVLRLDKEWEKIIDRLGRWVDMTNNYKTMDKTFMESVWWGFKQLYDKGLVYEGRKVILYCSRCATPLSNFEIAMDNSYQEVTEPSNTYKYKLNGQPDTYLLAWSTTPWNKLATPALAVNPDLTYVKVKQGDEFYILAESTLKMLTDQPHEIVETMLGKELEQESFELHYDFYPDRTDDQRAGIIIADEFVTADEGTGVVTLAVYGEDDFRVMTQHSIQLVEHVDEEGKLKPEVKPWAGRDILEVNPLVNADLAERGLMYDQKSHTHSVAVCYRCSTRLYYAPVPAWFINVAKLKDNLIAQNQSINWYPQYLKHGRFQQGLENAPDWNISRSRYWGTPMPIWAGEKDGQIIRRIIGSQQELTQWAVDPKQAADLIDIHREYLDDLEVWVDDAKTIKGTRIPEVFDCWVESGSMPFASMHYPFTNKAKFEANYPAQFVSEYIAQTRAWFYTMHVLSVGIFDRPPFENVLTTGTILAEDGSKMSKSKLNYPDPLLLINKYGVDSLRLYLMSSTVMKGENLNFSEKDVSDIRRKVFLIWWNMLSFYQSFADQSQPVTSPPQDTPDHVMDQWLLGRVENLIAEVTDYMDNYDVVRASRTLMSFIDELSTWYLRLSRDRLRADDNQQPSQVFGYALYRLAQLFAPFAPFFSEVVHHSMVDPATSIHLTDWPAADSLAVNQQLLTNMAEVKNVVEQARSLRRELEIKLRQPLAELTISSTQSRPDDDLLAVIKQEANVKQVSWQKADQLAVSYDTKLTPELVAEGEAREIARQIQNLRKKAGLKVESRVAVQLIEWPETWAEWIQEKTNSSKLIKGDQIKLLDPVS
jgi:isoleucyl-tRNA synthetase